MGDEPLVSPEEVASVLSSDDPESEAAPPSADAEPSKEYSLRRPMTIAAEDEAFARERITAIAEHFSRLLTRELDCEMVVEPKGFQQEQLSATVEAVEAPSWVLSFSMPGSGGIALVLEPAGAMTLVELALGGTGNTQSTGREPTPLEARVMNNLCTTLQPKLAKAARIELGGSMFKIDGVPQRMASAGEMIGASPVKLTIGETEHGGMLVATAGLLKPQSDEDEHGCPETIGPIARRLEKVPVEARPVLSAGSVSLNDILSLKKDVVLKLEVAEDTPLALRVEGQQLFVGRVKRQDEQMRFEVDWRRGGKSPGEDAGGSAAVPVKQEVKETA